jgi:hypothetical protein
MPVTDQSRILLSTNKKIRTYRPTIQYIVLYRCETWPRTFREEHRLRVFESRVLRKIFEHKRDKVTGDCCRPHNEQLYNLYSSVMLFG